MLQIVFKRNGERLHTIEFTDDDWTLSEYKTYEKTYKSASIDPPQGWGYHVSLWLERPPEKYRQEIERQRAPRNTNTKGGD